MRGSGGPDRGVFCADKGKEPITQIISGIVKKCVVGIFRFPVRKGFCERLTMHQTRAATDCLVMDGFTGFFLEFFVSIMNVTGIRGTSAIVQHVIGMLRTSPMRRLSAPGHCEIGVRTAGSLFQRLES